MPFLSRRAALIGGGAVALAGAGVFAARHRADAAYRAAEAEVWAPQTTRRTGDAGLRRLLVHYATLAANGHNTQPWRFRIEADGIRLLPDRTRRTPVVDPDDHHLFASLGCAAENLAVAAAWLGLAAEVRPLADAAFVALAPGGTETGRHPWFGALTTRRSVRLDYDGAPLAPGEWDAIRAAGTLPGLDLAIHTAAADRARLADLIVAGNTAQMGDPAFVAELKQWIRFDGAHAARTLDGLYAAASGNPTVPSWLGPHLFDLAFTPDAENAKYRGHVATSAGLVTILAAANTPPGWIQAGRAAQRMALAAAARDIRTAYLNQPTEALSVRPSFQAFLGTDRRPNLLLRFGRGPTTPRALRRPPDAVIVT